MSGDEASVAMSSSSSSSSVEIVQLMSQPPPLKPLIRRAAQAARARVTDNVNVEKIPDSLFIQPQRTATKSSSRAKADVDAPERVAKSKKSTTSTNTANTARKSSKSAAMSDRQIAALTEFVRNAGDVQLDAILDKFRLSATEGESALQTLVQRRVIARNLTGGYRVLRGSPTSDVVVVDVDDAAAAAAANDVDDDDNDGNDDGDGDAASSSTRAAIAQVAEFEQRERVRSKSSVAHKLRRFSSLANADRAASPEPTPRRAADDGEYSGGGDDDDDDDGRDNEVSDDGDEESEGVGVRRSTRAKRPSAKAAVETRSSRKRRSTPSKHRSAKAEASDSEHVPGSNSDSEDAGSRDGSEESFQRYLLENAATPKTKKERKARDRSRDHCSLCGQGGELLCCSTCARTWHVDCVAPVVSSTPHGPWSCPVCAPVLCRGCGDGVSQPTYDDENEVVVAPEPPLALMCRRCCVVRHVKCCDGDDSDDSWLCADCEAEGESSEVGSILAVRPVYLSKTGTRMPTAAAAATAARRQSDVGVDSAKRNVNHDAEAKAAGFERHYEYHVRWRGRAYCFASWIIDYRAPHVAWRAMPSFAMRLRKNNDGRDWQEVLHTLEDCDDYFASTDGCVRWGVHENWVVPDRVVARDGSSLLIKWRGLEYDEATWEARAWCAEHVPAPLIAAFEQRNDFDAAQKRLRQVLRYDQQNPKGKLARLTAQPRELSFGKLHDFQVDGVAWLRDRWQLDINCILADEMGLGKTIQSIGYLVSIARHTVRPALIVVPLSTLQNWYAEFARWAPQLNVVTFCGNQAARDLTRDHEFWFKRQRRKKGESDDDDGDDDGDDNDDGGGDGGGVSAAALAKASAEMCKFHVLLTTYEMATSASATFAKVHFESLIVDEAHRLKGGSASRLFNKLMPLNVNHRVLLTGTPLQNTLQELFHLMKFLKPREFGETQALERRFNALAKAEVVSTLHSMLLPHLLRRLKKDVIKDLPQKEELVVRVDMTPLQRKYYRALLTHNYTALTRRGGGRVSLLNVCMQLRKAVNHPYLFPDVEPSTAGVPPEQVLRLMINGSGKMLVLDEMLRQLRAGGHRVLIFSQMTHMLDILEDYMHLRNYEYERIDGDVSGQLRQNRIDNFNRPDSDAFVFLLSTRAGGLGINLATADTVITFDSDYNPHNDLQAFARAHRIGQKNKVMIYRLITRASVEERLLQIARNKMVLEHVVVSSAIAAGGDGGLSLKQSELDDILKYGAKELFADGDDVATRFTWEDAANDEVATVAGIKWDAGAVAKLLDRSGGGADGAAATTTGEAGGVQGEGFSKLDEYLSSFKVAEYSTQAGADKGDELWDQLLKERHDEEERAAREAELMMFGKGKRVRKAVYYNDDEPGAVAFGGVDSSVSSDDGASKRRRKSDKAHKAADDDDDDEEFAPANDALAVSDSDDASSGELDPLDLDHKNNGNHSNSFTFGSGSTPSRQRGTKPVVRLLPTLPAAAGAAASASASIATAAAAAAASATSLALREAASRRDPVVQGLGFFMQAQAGQFSAHRELLSTASAAIVGSLAAAQAALLHGAGAQRANDVLERAVRVNQARMSRERGHGGLTAEQRRDVTTFVLRFGIGDGSIEHLLTHGPPSLHAVDQTLLQEYVLSFLLCLLERPADAAGEFWQSGVSRGDLRGDGATLVLVRIAQLFLIQRRIVYQAGKAFDGSLLAGSPAEHQQWSSTPAFWHPTLDEALLLGVLRHGWGNWVTIGMDVELVALVEGAVDAIRAFRPSAAVEPMRDSHSGFSLMEHALSVISSDLDLHTDEMVRCTSDAIVRFLARRAELLAEIVSREEIALQQYERVHARTEAKQVPSLPTLRDVVPQAPQQQQQQQQQQQPEQPIVRPLVSLPPTRYFPGVMVRPAKLETTIEIENEPPHYVHPLRERLPSVNDVNRYLASERFVEQAMKRVQYPYAIEDDFAAILVVRWAWRESSAPPDLMWIVEVVTGGNLERAERLLFVALLVFGGGREQAVPARFRRVALSATAVAMVNQARIAPTDEESAASATRLMSATILPRWSQQQQQLQEQQ